MISNDFIRLTEGIIVFAGLGAMFWAVFKNRTTQDIITNQSELIKTLQAQIQAIRDEASDLRQKHIENEKAVAKLAGQVEVYKELPLGEMQKHMETIAATQVEILKLVKK